MGTKFNRFVRMYFNWIEKVFSFLNAVLVAIMIVVVLADVFATFFKYPITITTELTGLTFAWITGFSGVLIAMGDENISLTIIKDKFTGVPGKLLDTVIDMFCLGFSCLMFAASWEMCVSMHSLYMPLFRFPKSIPYGSMLVMFGLIMVTMVLRIIQRFLVKEEGTP